MDHHSDMQRRFFLKKIALGSVLTAGILAALGIARAIIPKLTLDKSIYKIGLLADLPINSYTLNDKAGCYIFRDHRGVRAVSSLCTHLGCTLEKSENGFNCPCHGSFFDENGRVISGPAPRSLVWFKVSLAADGQLVVDKKQHVSVNDIFLIS